MNDNAVDTKAERRIRAGQTVRVVTWVVILALVNRRAEARVDRSVSSTDTCPKS